MDECQRHVTLKKPDTKKYKILEKTKHGGEIRIMVARGDWPAANTKELFEERKIFYILDIPHGPEVKIQPSSAGDAGSVPSQRTKIPPAVWYGQKNFF